jgi:hypothetical protein
LLNQIWELDRAFTNYLLPQQKLVSKTRYGAKMMTKVHDTPATPHKRAAADPRIDEKAAIGMNANYPKVRPAALSRQMTQRMPLCGGKDVRQQVTRLRNP